jgi:signal transduction histidine kinase
VFSRELAIHPSEGQTLNILPLIESSFSEFLQNNGFCAGFFCIWNDETTTIELLATQGIPMSPFIGTKKDSLEVFIKTCLERYPAPHIHSLSDSQLWKEIKALVDTNNWQPQAIFVPAFVSQSDFIFVCFSIQSKKPEINHQICSMASEVVQLANFLISVNEVKDRLYLMEIYVREIGHDIASSVQAIISKLRNVRRGLLQGPAAMAKIQEAEDEIMSTYRIADTLGITVDPDYNVGLGDYFYLRDAFQDVITLVQSEAEERHIDLRTDLPKENISLWGDVKAIQSALMQLLMNAIKYAKGSSYVVLRANDNGDDVEFSVTDMGIPIDPEDQSNMWKFGWRGKKAKELHVNGSGIGLYTVKKVIKAHGGSVGYRSGGKNNEIVTFSFSIPKKEILKKTNLY